MIFRATSSPSRKVSSNIAKKTPQICKFLLENGGDTDQKNSVGWTPLHEACYFNHLDTVQLLLVHGADATIKNVSTKLRNTHITSRHITSRHVTSRHTTSQALKILAVERRKQPCLFSP